MTGLGNRLKEARTAKGFTLDDLQSITKIQKRYLANIENEEYNNMPGSFYVRAFIKQYAEAVGLNADEMLLLYKDSPAAVLPEEEEQKLATPTLSRRGGKRNNELTEAMPKIIVALFIVVIIVVLWFFYVNNTANKNSSEVGTDNPITVQDQQTSSDKPDTIVDEDKNEEDKQIEDKKNEDEPDPETEKAEQSLEFVSVNGEDSTYTLENVDEFSLEIRTNDDSWIGVLDSTRTERMPTPGARLMVAEEAVELDVSDTDSVRIRVGRTASTEILVNGELLDYESDRTTQNIIIEYKKEQ